MENTSLQNSTLHVDSVPTEPTELQIQPPPPPLPRPEHVLDPTDLSDTTESEAEKHGCKYFLTNISFYFDYIYKNFKILVYLSGDHPDTSLILIIS